MRQACVRGMWLAQLVLVIALGLNAADPFVPGGPNTRGRVTVKGPAVLSDWGTQLRGACWCQDCHGGTPARAEFTALRAAGLNSIHVYVEKNDDKPVGYESEHLDSIVEWCQESLYVVMTFGNSHLTSYAKVLDFWRFYAPRYKDMTHVVYEAKNEGCYGTSNCAEIAMQAYRDIYAICKELAPQTHVMLMSHSNLAGGIPPLFTDVERLGPDVDWTNASIAFHGYYGSGSFQANAAKTLGDSGYAMSCTEFPFGSSGDLAKGYESAGISYFWFEACWGGQRTPGNIKGYISGKTSWAPDFGDWPQAQAERPVVGVASGSRWGVMSASGGPAVSRLLFGNPTRGQVDAVYDVTGRKVWSGRGEAPISSDGFTGQARGSQLLLVKYRP